MTNMFLRHYKLKISSISHQQATVEHTGICQTLRFSSQKMSLQLCKTKNLFALLEVSTYALWALTNHMN
jgi:hypothetical protein